MWWTIESVYCLVLLESDQFVRVIALAAWQQLLQCRTVQQWLPAIDWLRRHAAIRMLSVLLIELLFCIWTMFSRL